MRIYSFGIAALVGILLLFVAWLADREKRAGIERLGFATRCSEPIFQASLALFSSRRVMELALP